MALYVASITVDKVIEALGAFVQPFAPGAPVIRGQQNRVAMPVTGFVELTELLQVDLETPVATSALAQVDLAGPKRIDIQMDFYGPSAGDWCTAVKGVYRSCYAYSLFPDGIKPLYCSDGNQSPLDNGEEQYELRWIITASLQYNPVVSMPQQSAVKLAVHTLEDLS